jgi:purine-binding chemotaxis protein CheW
MLAGATADRVSHLVLIGEGRWGLAASAIGQVISLRPEDVKWRGSQGQRPWLAGTVIQHMCALLEVEAFLELLVEGTRRGGVA